MIKVDSRIKGKKNKLSKSDLLAQLLYNIVIIVANSAIEK